jgi:murein DD-endopeptidase MepM/ murein hydrolase activator NlpD
MRRAFVGVLVTALLLASARFGADAESIQSIRDRIDALRKQVEQASSELDAANNGIEAVQQRLGFDRQQLAATLGQLNRVQAGLAGEVSALYRSGGLAMMDALLDDDAKLVPDRLEFATVLVGQRTDLLGDIKTAAASYRTAVRQLQFDRARALELGETAQRTMDALTAQLKQQAALLDRLVGFPGGRASYPPSIVTANGLRIACPVEPPYTFTDTYGAPRSGGRTHKGVDIIAPYGAREFAYESGVLRRAANSLGGLTLYLEGDSGIEYYYAHLSGYVGVPGRVQVGQLVGYVGNTGDARFTVAHLHFEVHPGGRGSAPVDPTPYATRACG